MTDYRFTCKYERDVTMVVGSTSKIGFMGTKWHGDDGWIHVNRRELLASDPRWIRFEEIGPGDKRLYRSDDRVQNFVDCVKSRSSRLSQAAIEQIIRNTSPTHHDAIEDRLIEILKDPASTYAARQFVCRMLQRIGLDRSIPHLARMLLDEQLTDDARLAMQGHESAEIDRVLRESLDRLSGTALIGVIGTIGQRRDRAAVPRLVELVDTTDTELTRASIISLGQIGGAGALG